MSYSPPLKPLTTSESNFAAEHHDIVLRFLSHYRLSYSEYYDVVIMRYLRACKNYCCEERLRKYAFSTIAFKAMSSAVYNYQKSLRNKFTLNLDAFCDENNCVTLGDLLPDLKADVLQTVINRETIKEYFSGKKVKQNDIGRIQI